MVYEALRTVCAFSVGFHESGRAPSAIDMYTLQFVELKSHARTRDIYCRRHAWCSTSRKQTRCVCEIMHSPSEQVYLIRFIVLTLEARRKTAGACHSCPFCTFRQPHSLEYHSATPSYNSTLSCWFRLPFLQKNARRRWSIVPGVLSWGYATHADSSWYHSTLETLSGDD